MAKHSNGPARPVRRDGGNQKPAKHRADIGVSMKTLHGSRVNGVDAILWRNDGVSKRSACEKKARQKARPEELTLTQNIQRPARTP